MPDVIRPAAALLVLFGATSLANFAHAQDAHLARNLAATCANCHGTNGQAKGKMKSLAAMPADKLIAYVADFKSGAQSSTIMQQIVKGYSDEQIKLIASFYAAQPAAK